MEAEEVLPVENDSHQTRKLKQKVRRLGAINMSNGKAIMGLRKARDSAADCVRVELNRKILALEMELEHERQKRRVAEAFVSIYICLECFVTHCELVTFHFFHRVMLLRSRSPRPEAALKCLKYLLVFQFELKLQRIPFKVKLMRLQPLQGRRNEKQLPKRPLRHTKLTWQERRSLLTSFGHCVAISR